jgi:nucleotide-binding universal stress UspA family protein
MELNNIILVPTDFSEVCKNAIEQSIQIGKETGFGVYIYHVINKQSEDYFGGSKNIEEKVEDKLKALKSEVEDSAGVEIHYGYEQGSIFDLIHVKASDIGANLIILGTHGKKGMQHLLGSFALKVLTKAAVPTLVVQHKKYLGFKNVLLPINSKTEARQGVQIAIAVAKFFNCTIHLYKESSNDSTDNHRIGVITNQIADVFNKNKVRFVISSAEKTGDSAKIVIEHAVQNNIDMIMILTQPQIGSAIFSLGSWNEKFMFNEAQIPVMCINPVEHGHAYFDL